LYRNDRGGRDRARATVPAGRTRLAAGAARAWNALSRLVRVLRNDSLRQALDKMAALNVDELPVVRNEAPDEIVSVISKRDIVNDYDAKTGT